MGVSQKFPEENLPKWQQLLLVITDLSKTNKGAIKFEDIVVGAFKRFPESFHLRGYQEFPDSGDLVHKPLYDMRKNGLLNANQKTFSLTNKGIEAANRLSKSVSKGGSAHFKPDRSIGKEIERIISSDAFAFFDKGTSDKILDTDFYQYLSVSVHTSKNEFLNRLETVEFAISKSRGFYPENISKKLKSFHTFMTDKFKDILSEISNKKERNG
jgi:hypothetical protein